MIDRRILRLRGNPNVGRISGDGEGVSRSQKDDRGFAASTGEGFFGGGVPTATKPNLSAVSDVAEEETRGFFEEPQPKGITEKADPYISAQYPYNHVHESESGHIHEIDDSPGAERLFTQHKSGTFEEIHPDGSKVVKVIGDNYEIIAGGSNVYVSGNVNLTIEGTVREYIKGNYHLEVEGDYTQKIGGNIRTKVGYKSGGNVEEEINGNHAYYIKGYVRGNVGPLEESAAPGEGDIDINITGSKTEIIGKKSTIFSEDDMKLIANNDLFLSAQNDMTIATTSGIMSFKSGSDLDMRSQTAMIIKTESTMTQTSTSTFQVNTDTTYDLNATTEVDIDSALINLN